jgi:hypothetical protein
METTWHAVYVVLHLTLPLISAGTSKHLLKITFPLGIYSHGYDFPKTSFILGECTVYLYTIGFLSWITSLGIHKVHCIQCLSSPRSLKKVISPHLRSGQKFLCDLPEICYASIAYFTFITG